MKEREIIYHVELKALVIRKLTELGGKVDEHSENFNKELENFKKKNQSKLKNIITEMKNTLEGINSRLGDTEECISDMEFRIMEITQLEQQKEKQILKHEDSLRDLWDNIKHTSIHMTGVPERENTRNV